MGQAVINRRQFMVRGGAAAVALGLFAQLPASARAAGSAAAETGATLADTELDVVAGLISAICVANLKPATEAAALGLQTPSEFAAAYAACDGETRAAISAVLDAVEHGPGAQLFSSLSAYTQAQFIGGTFAELELYEATAQDQQVLEALTDSTNALVSSLHQGALGSVVPPAQPAVPRPQPVPFYGSGNERYVFTQTLLCALTLVSEPLFGDEQLVAAPTLDPATAAALDQWLAHRSEGGLPPRHLVKAINSDLAGALPAQLEHRVYPSVAMAQALTAWLAVGRI